MSLIILAAALKQNCFAGLDVPIAIFAPEKAIERLGRFVEAVLSERRGDLANGLIELEQNPFVVGCQEHSINLAFVRLLHDIETYEIAATGVQLKKLLADPDDPQRQAYLQRFVDADSRRFLMHFYKDYKGLNPDEALDLLVRRARPLPKRLATLYLSAHPDARLAHLQQFLAAHMPQQPVSENELWDLYLTYSPERLNLLRAMATEGRLPQWTAWWDEDDVALLFPDRRTRLSVSAEQSRLPLSYYEQQIPVPGGWDNQPCGYLLFGPPYDRMAQEARERDWDVEQVPGGHLHQLVDPDAVAARIVAMTGRWRFLAD